MSGTKFAENTGCSSTKLTVSGLGQDLLTIDAQQQSRVLNFSALSGNLTLEDLTLTRGRTTGNNVTYPPPGDSTYSGGGIRFISDGMLTLSRSTLSENSTTGDHANGGGIFNLGGTLTVTNSTLSGNSTMGNYASGGGIFVENGTATVANSTLSGNSASQNGGGISNPHGSTTVTNSTVSENLARNGGGISNQDGLTVISSTLSGNSASNVGGGVSNSNTATVINSTLSGNSASNFGGGVSNSSGDFTIATLTVTNSTLSGNSASNGGGISNRPGRNGKYTSATVTNSTLRGNSADTGGGIFNRDGFTVTGSTLTGNSADIGGGIYSEHFGGRTSTISSSIVANSVSGGDIAVNAGSLVGSYNLIEDGSGVGLIGTITGDPLLAPLANNGGTTQTHALLPGSPAIDAGDPSFVPLPHFDQRGMPFSRVFGGVIDIGALEFINGDFNGDGVYTCADVDALVATIAAATNDVSYDLNSDLLVNQDDLDTWLAVAGVANLPSHKPFLKGDANLDGVVDVTDFNVWNENKFTNASSWCRGDFNADGVIDVSDFNAWNEQQIPEQRQDISLRITAAYWPDQTVERFPGPAISRTRRAERLPARVAQGWSNLHLARRGRPSATGPPPATLATEPICRLAAVPRVEPTHLERTRLAS